MASESANDGMSKKTEGRKDVFFAKTRAPAVGWPAYDYRLREVALPRFGA